MWNYIASNRILDKKRKQDAQKKHLSALNNIKSQIDNTKPHSYSFLYTRPKARMLKFQRQMNIENTNNLLVQKMLNVSMITRPKSAYFKDSLNFSYNKKLQSQIDNENQALVKRLRSATSQYGQRQFSKFVSQYAKAKSNISKSRLKSQVFELQMPKPKSRRLFSASSKNRPFSAKV